MLQFFRKTHLYIGVFTAPAILFFAFSGALQTFSLHDFARDGSYKPAKWIVILAQIHKKQITQVPQKKAASPDASQAETPKKKDKIEAKPATQVQPISAQLLSPVAATQSSVSQEPHNPVPLRMFFLLVCISLFISTASGIYLAVKYRRDRIAIAVLLVAGIVAPLLLMRL
jgi:hypothetical protein